MRFVIHGAGALGSLVGGRLAASGAKVVLVGRDPHIAAIMERGLEIRSPEDRQIISNLSAYTSLDSIIPSGPTANDILILAVKSAATPLAVQELRERFGETTPLFCLQNGIRNEELAARRFLHVYGIMAGLVVRMIEPGVVAQIFYNDLALGGYPLGCEGTGRQVAEALRQAGFNVTTHDSIMAVKWSKLVLNLNNATLAIIDCHLQLAMVTPPVALFMAEVVDEALRVLEAAGIPVIEPANPYNLAAYVEQLRQISRGPHGSAAVDAARHLSVDQRAYPSTWTDLQEERGDTEAGFLNGEIILLGEKFGVPTPYNSTLLNVVEQLAVERARPGRFSIEQLSSLVSSRS
ncbi:MAG: ketopantoate reductase family protein [Acidobacteriota bacterium]